MVKSPLWRAVAAISVFLITYLLGDFLRFMGLRAVLDYTSFSLAVNLIQMALAVAGIMLVFRIGPFGAAKELGLKMPAKRALAFAFLATLPMLLAFAFTSSISAKATSLSIFAFGVFSPFAEELVFRGYLFRQLYRRAKLGFWPAAVMPSLLFGAGHIYQSNNFSEILGIVAITGLGSLFFCWIYMRWQDNLWVPFALHCLMNTHWMLFAVDETALGGWLANIARLATVLAAILLTVYKDKIWKRLHAENANVAEFDTELDDNASITNRIRLAGQAT
ncbi:MAG: CPBP family intramembrane metalloprotease [Pyrinomonadaceae bacterium]|nr:CPBP family intramembrane metalloprotease [Pyrinomonadaceae bacterium]